LNLNFRRGPEGVGLYSRYGFWGQLHIAAKDCITDLLCEEWLY